MADKLKHIILLLSLISVSTLNHAVMPVSGSLTPQGKAAGIIVKMRNDSTPAIIADAGGQPRLSAQVVEQMKVVAAADLSYKRTASLGTHVLNFPQTMNVEDAQAIADLLKTMPDVAYAVPNLIFNPTLTPNDTNFGTQWSLNDPTTGANLPAAWNTTTGSNTAVIAILDTGYTNHSELNYSNFVSDGYDFISDSALAGDGDGRDSNARDEGDYCTIVGSTRDSSWHGTSVMSVIGAITNNNSLMAGVNWNPKMIPVRVLGRCGGTLDDILDAIRWAVGLTVSGVPANTNPAKIINMSLGGIGLCDAITQATINEAHAAGAVIIAAAGNEGIPAAYSSPANCQNVMSIAAHAQDGDIAWFSNYGDVDLAAAGVDIYLASCSSTTTYSCDSSTTMATESGTSFSAPLVSGVASLIFSVDSSLNNYYVEQILRESARPFLAGSNCINNCGAGMLDAAAALALITNFISPANRIEITDDSGGAVQLWFWLGLGLLAIIVSQRRIKRL